MNHPDCYNIQIKVDSYTNIENGDNRFYSTFICNEI